MLEKNNDQKVELKLKASNTETFNGLIDLINSRKISSMVQRISFKKVTIKGASKHRPTLDRFPNFFSISQLEFIKLAIDFSKYPSMAYFACIKDTALSLIKCKLLNLRSPLPKSSQPNLTL